MPNIKEQNRSFIWKDRLWTLCTIVIGAVLGAVLTLGATIFHGYREDCNTRKNIITMLKSDIEQHVKEIESCVNAFDNIKKGLAPDYFPPAKTIDKSFLSGSVQPLLILKPHESLVFESSLPKLHLLSHSIIGDILKFYKWLSYCELHRKNVEKTLYDRAFRIRTDDAPTCDVYLDMLTLAEKLGKELLIELQNGQS